MHGRGTTGVLAGVAVAAVLATAPAGAGEVIFAHGAHPGNPRTIAAEKWAELFTSCTGGRHTVKVAPAATMGDDVEMLTSAISGVIQVTANSQGPLAQLVPEVGLLGLPFLFEDLPTAWKVLDGEVGSMLAERVRGVGLELLGFWDNGIRHVSHVAKLVPQPADIRGMKIRTPPDPMTVAIFEALGASPAPLAFSELPSALQAGVFDGQENPLVNIWSAKLHTITPYITLTGHKYESTPVLAGGSWWAELDGDSRRCALEATREAGAMQREMVLRSEAELKPQMEAEGVVFGEADRAAYRAATASVYDRFAKDHPEMVAALKRAAGHE